MQKILKILAAILFICVASSFEKDEKEEVYGLNIEKSIKEIEDNLFEVAVVIRNADAISGFARYEAKLPLSADYVKEVSRDKVVNFKLDGRKIKMIWMHLQKQKTYKMVFQIRSKLPVNKLKMNGKFSGHYNGEIFSIEDSSNFVTN